MEEQSKPKDAQEVWEWYQKLLSETVQFDATACFGLPVSLLPDSLDRTKKIVKDLAQRERVDSKRHAITFFYISLALFIPDELAEKSAQFLSSLASGDLQAAKEVESVSMSNHQNVLEEELRLADEIKGLFPTILDELEPVRKEHKDALERMRNLLSGGNEDEYIEEHRQKFLRIQVESVAEAYESCVRTNPGINVVEKIKELPFGMAFVDLYFASGLSMRPPALAKPPGKSDQKEELDGIKTDLDDAHKRHKIRFQFLIYLIHLWVGHAHVGGRHRLPPEKEVASYQIISYVLEQRNIGEAKASSGCLGLVAVGVGIGIGLLILLG